jgi:hypothetical protein
MLDTIIYLLLSYAYVVAAILFLIKTFLFFKNKNKNWRLVEFLYFTPTNIQFTSNVERAKLKRVQNQLSGGVILFLLIQLVVALLM